MKLFLLAVRNPNTYLGATSRGELMNMLGLGPFFRFGIFGGFFGADGLGLGLT
jgi:hypothetical protein